MRTVTRFPCNVVEEPDAGIVLSDGCRLSARIWRPADGPPVPAILEFIPYRKRDGTAARDALIHPYLAGHGYACLRVDLRGSGDSGGLLEDEYSARELADACAVIAWAAAQPWCSGAVGMMGKSWGGFNALQTAALRPPALKAVISVMATADRFADDIHFKGGALLGENFGWASTMLAYSARPADPALRADWRADWLRRLEALPFLAPVWTSHQTRDAYWRHGSVCEDWTAITVPVLYVAGWADNYMNAAEALVANLRAPVQAVIGPWVHQYPHMATPGPRIGFLQLALRWWDRWLKNMSNGAEDDPLWRVFVPVADRPDASARQRAGRWIAAGRGSGGPVPQRRLALALSPGGMLGGPGGATGAIVRSPQHLGLFAGEFFPMGPEGEMAGDQRHDDALSCRFDTAPLGEGLDLFGRPVLTLRLAADRPKATLIARLCAVAPDGASLRLSHGVLNLCHRNGADAPAPLIPGETVTVRLPLDLMAAHVPRGHRLRLALSTAYWPFVWPQPFAATLALAEGALDLPHLDGPVAGWDPPGPEAGPPWRHRRLSPARSARRIETDLLPGRHALVIESDSGDAEDLAHGLIAGEAVSERWEIAADDPLSAAAAIRWEQRLARGDWRVRIVTETGMTATGETLRMTARVTAFEGGAQVFRRDWDETVPRTFV